MKTIAGILLVLAALSLSSASVAQVRIQGGNVTLTVSTGTPGGDPTPATVSTNTLRWSQERVITKITVSTICPGQKFTLRVVASGIGGGGTAAPEVSLQNGMLATDFVTDIPPRRPNNGSCTVRYTATATFEQGNSTELGDDIHTVTYTITAQ